MVVLNDLSTGLRNAVIAAALPLDNVSDQSWVAKVLLEHDVDMVMHFAARTIVPESVADPSRYYGNNTCATRNLRVYCKDAGVARIVFSSTAAVYGIPPGIRPASIRRSRPSTLCRFPADGEWMLRDLAADGPRYVALRYVNAAGGNPCNAKS